MKQLRNNAISESRTRSFRPIAALVVIVLAQPARSQNRTTSGTSSSAIVIVQSTSIFKTADLQFGAIVPGSTGGVVTISPSGSRSATGTIYLPKTLSFGAATFTVLGYPNQTFSISLPTSVVLGLQTGSATMTITNLVTNPSAGGTLSQGGAATVSLGGTLQVAANQSYGQYSGAFNVTVSYP